MTDPKPLVAGGTRGQVQLLVSLVGLGLVLAVVSLAYVRAFDADFQFDDVRGILRNEAIRDLRGFSGGVVAANWAAGGRPVTNLTFAVDHALAGWDRRQFHSTSISLHLATIVVLFVLTAGLLRRVRARAPELVALGVVALWGVHPIHTQAVTYVSQRSEVLSALLSVVALLVLARALGERQASRAALLGVAGFAIFIFALGAKPNAVVVPVLLVLYAACLHTAPGAPPPWRRVALVASPFLVAGATGVAKLVSSFHGRTDVGFEIEGITATQYALTQLRAIVLYLRLIFWPSGLVLDRDFRVSSGLDAETAAAGFAVAALVAGAIWLIAWARRRPVEESGPARLAALGIGWFLVCLAPTSSVVPLADVVMEHRVFLASWGVVLAVAALALHLARRTSGLRATAVAGCFVAAAMGALGVATHRRNAVWLTTESLWADSAAKSPRKMRPHLNLGQALWARGDNEGALAEYRTALALVDRRTTLDDRAKLYLNVAAAYGGLGRYEESTAMALRGLKLDPDSLDLLNNIVVSLRRRNDPAAARPYAERAARLAPRSADAHTALGHVLTDTGDLAGAVREFEVAFALEDRPLAPAIGGALASERLGAVTDACRWWRRVADSAHTEKQRTEATGRAERLGCPRP